MPFIAIDPKTTALVLIDLEQGIVSRPLAPYSGQDVLKNAVQLASAFRRHKATVVLVHVDMADMLKLPADSPMMDPNAPPPPPAASQLVSEIGPEPGDIVITKRQWGAFYATALDQQLRRRSIQTIVLGGIATNFGVESTARAASEYGYAQIFVEDAMTSMSAEMHKFAIDNVFPKIGKERTLAEVLQALG